MVPRIQEGTLLNVYQFIIKDTTREQPNGRDAWDGGGGSLELPCPLQASPRSSTPEYSPTHKLSEPCPLGILWKYHYVGMID